MRSNMLARVIFCFECQMIGRTGYWATTCTDWSVRGARSKGCTILFGGQDLLEPVQIDPSLQQVKRTSSLEHFFGFLELKQLEAVLSCPARENR